MLAQPAQALTDLALGLAGLAFALRLPPETHRYWRTAFLWFSAAALAGALHHGAIAYRPEAADASWAVISVMVVVSVSYLLAGTVVETLGPGRTGTFWLLRSVGVLAYVAVAASGHAGIGTILACESVTMAGVVALWLRAAVRRHPLAPQMLLAVAASALAATATLLDEGLLAPARLDPTSVYHLAQIAGIALLFRALRRGAARERQRPEAAAASPRPAHEVSS